MTALVNLMNMIFLHFYSPIHLYFCVCVYDTCVKGKDPITTYKNKVKD